MTEARATADAEIADANGADANGADEVAGDLTGSDAEGAETDPAPQIDPSLMEEAAALVDNVRTYAEAELGFQKTRAGYAGRLIGVSIGLVLFALILLHIAFLALAVGLVLAFEPIVGIWGSIGIVFGALLLVVAILGWGAFTRMQKLGSLFASPAEEDV